MESIVSCSRQVAQLLAIFLDHKTWMIWILVYRIIPTHPIQWHQAAEAPFGLSLSQQLGERMLVLRFLAHDQPGMSRIQVGDFYGILRADDPAQVIPFAARLDDRGGHRKVNTVHRAMVNTKGAGGIRALLHIDSVLRSILHGFSINFYGELRTQLVTESTIYAILPAYNRRF